MTTQRPLTDRLHWPCLLNISPDHPWSGAFVVCTGHQSWSPLLSPRTWPPQPPLPTLVSILCPHDGIPTGNREFPLEVTPSPQGLWLYLESPPTLCPHPGSAGPPRAEGRCWPEGGEGEGPSRHAPHTPPCRPPVPHPCPPVCVPPGPPGTAGPHRPPWRGRGERRPGASGRAGPPRPPGRPRKCPPR